MDSEIESKKNETYDIKLRKSKAKELLDQFIISEKKDEKKLDEIMSLDDTLPDVYIYKLRNSRDDIKLKERSLDLVDKNALKEFSIDKKINYKEIYFKLIEYISSISLDEPKDASNGFDLEEFLNEEENDSENQSSSKEEFKKVLDKRISLDIEPLLIKKEKIKVNDIKIKLSQIYESCCSFINYKNNYPEFESELFYFNCLRYMLDTYKTLKYKRFIKKIKLTKYMSPLTDKIQKNKANYNLTKLVYYYIMNTQYYIVQKFLDLLIYEDLENKDLLPEYKKDFFIKYNKLYYKDEIILENADNYLINKMIKRNIIFKDEIDYIEGYYSLKGLLNNSLFTKEDGDKFWEEFLSSKILDDLVQNLYKKENIFNQKIIKDLFKERSFYFPNFNKSFIALSHKELFNMYFPPSQIKYPSDEFKDSYIVKMIDKAVNKIKIHHEWGHTASSFLFFTFKIKYISTPERNIKLKSDSKNNENYYKEGGQSVEILMFGRVIEELSAKEAIFILNKNNYKLPLNEFRSEFMSLGKKKLEDIFKKELNNPDVDNSVIKAYEEYNNKGGNFQLSLENYSFRIKGNKKKYINLDNIRFKIGKNYHHKISRYLKK